MRLTHIRTARGEAFCGARWHESISLQHWQLARSEDDWMGLATLPVPLCRECRWESAWLLRAEWPSLGDEGVKPAARWKA